MNDNKKTSGGISFLGILTIVFIVLKLCHVITWSWFWVLSPTLIPLIIMAIFILVFIISEPIQKRRTLRLAKKKKK